MGKNHSIQINDEKLYMAIYEFCKANGRRLNDMCTEMLRKQFMIEQYGDIPFGNLITLGSKTGEKLVDASMYAEIKTQSTDESHVETASTSEEVYQEESIVEDDIRDSSPIPTEETSNPKPNQQHQKPLITQRPRKRKL